ncbi:MAG TPA: PAS domain-containing protein [Acidobacteriaceae bacterium]|nr:PAS domain-containing protein [Acidobacteriaceae bacterium]
MQLPKPSLPPTSTEIHTDALDLVEKCPEGIVFLDREWRITYANESARRISRIEPHHLNGPTHWEIYPATVGTRQEEVYRTSMEQRISLEHEFYYAPFDVWISLRTMPISTGIAVHYRDISRVRKAEARRDESARQLQQVFEVTTDAIVLLDRNYNLSFLNRRAKELLAPSGELLGRNLWAAFPEAVYEGSPYVETYRRAMEERLPGSFEAYYPEPLNVWLTIEVRPAEDGIIVFFRDVTEERAAAEELRRKTAEAERQAAEIETVYRTAPIGLALFDPVEFRYLRLNDRQAAFFGLKPEDVLGRTLTEMAPIPGLRELFEDVLAGTPVVNYPLEGELISHPGEHRYWTVNYFPVHAPDGSIQAISAASLEITQQKKAEHALIQSEKVAAVGRLASSISHEINNPLESVINLLYLISCDPNLSLDVKEYVELTQAEINRVSQIVTQTLRFHRQAVRPTLVTAAELIEPILNLYRGRLVNSEVKVQARFSTSTPVLCMENEIHQVLSNLIANAIDAMRQGGELLLRAHDTTDHATGKAGIRITVADTGHGMSRATQARIFEPFFTTKELNGTGLGLWISAGIVERHKGRLSVRSSQEPRHSGTVFHLFLPLAES